MRSLLALLLFLVCPALAAADSPPAPLKVGVIMPLTGPGASWGEHMNNALQLALESLPAAERDSIKLVVEDDQLQAARAVSAFNRLADVEGIAVGIVFGGASVGATAGLAERKQIPCFMITANPALTAGKVYSFRDWLGADEQVRALVPAIATAGVRHAALVVTTQEATLDFAARLKRAVAERGVQTVFEQDFAPAETDFRSAIGRLAAAKPDGIFMGLLPPHISAFTRQLREAHLQLPIFGASNTGTASEVAAAQGALEGVVYSSPTLTDDFIARYQAKYGKFPELSAGNVYDMLLMIALAARSGARNPAAITEFLRTLRDFNGALGHYGLGTDNSFELRAELRTVRNGRFERVR